MSAPDRLTIPRVFGELADERRWVCWRYETRNGKPTKVPVQPNGRRAKSDDPQTWTALSRCVTYAEATPGVGVGIVFNGDGLVGIDLDDCIDPSTGELAEWAEQVVAGHASYTEKTPSGRGLHILCRGTLPGGATGTKRGKIEVYATGRYFTVTGSAWPGAPDEITDAQEALERLWTDLDAHGAPCAANGAGEASSAAYQAGDGPDTPWRRLNTSALAKLGAWVPELFGDAAKFVKGKGGYRIAAAALGRDLEEDLSIMPHGIRDWGMGDLGPDGADYGRQGKRTPIDLVLEFGGAPDELAAARWLADRLGKKLEDFGFASSPSEREAKAEGGPEAGEGKGWGQLLLRNDRGQPLALEANVCVALRRAPELRGRLRLNKLSETIECRGLPWDRGEPRWRGWNDADDAHLAEHLQRQGLRVRPIACATAALVVAHDVRVHPVRDWLHALQWDGTPRLDGWLCAYLGATAEDLAQHAYLQEVGRRWMIGAVARVFRPGCKVDATLILEGPQGCRKSTACRTLVPDEAWFADEVADLGTKDAAQDLRGKWLLELSELSAMRRGEVERVKSFISRAVDHYRPSHGRHSRDFPRQCVFIGTTNSDAYLSDETGARRFWPVQVGAIDIPALERDRGQLWGEAVAAYRAGERWWLDRDTERHARVEQEDRRQEDAWEAAIATWISDKAETSIEDLLEHVVRLPMDRRDQTARNRVARVLRARKWKRFRKRIGGELEWGYRRETGNTPRETENAAKAENGPAETGNKVPQTGNTGNGKAAEILDVPSVPSMVDMHESMGAAYRHNTRDIELYGHAPGTGNTGNSDPRAPAWTDHAAWIGRFRNARGRDARTEVVLAWAQAAGCERDGARLTVPSGLPQGLARSDLLRLVREHGLSVEMPAGAAP